MIQPYALQTDTDSIAATANSDSFDVKKSTTLGVLVEYTVAAATVKTFADGDVNVANNTATITSHGYYTGRKVAATSSGTLPAGLSATDYYIIRVDADTIKFATSFANAAAGTAVDITAAAGGGTHTLTPAAISGASYKIQGSLDNTTWFDLVANDLQPVSGNITATGSAFWHHDTVAFNYTRVAFTISTAGQFTYIVSVLSKD